MAQNSNTINVDEMMNFDPSNMNAFKEPESKVSGNENIYKCDIDKVDKTKVPDGHYHSKVRLVINPKSPQDSIMFTVRYYMQDANGNFTADSRLALGDKNCPIFKAWKQLHFKKDDEAGKAFGDSIYQKNESNWCTVQIIEDENRPDLVGHFMEFKLPKTIYMKMQSKMNPVDPTKTPAVDLMNYLFGPVLNIDVTPGPEDPKAPERRKREQKYDLSDFSTDPQPIIMTDGKALFTDEEVETIEAYDSAKKEFLKAKTDKKREECKKKAMDAATAVKPLMQKAIDYVTENCLDLRVDCGFHEWSPELRERIMNWISIVNATDPTTGKCLCQDPSTFEPSGVTLSGVASAPTAAPESGISTITVPGSSNEDLPF